MNIGKNSFFILLAALVLLLPSGSYAQSLPDTLKAHNRFLPQDTTLCANANLTLDISGDYTCHWLDKDSIVLPFGTDTNTFVITGKRGLDGLGGGTDTRQPDTYILHYTHRTFDSISGMDTLQVFNLVQPTVLIPSDTLICRNEPVAIEPVLPRVYEPFYVLSWDDGSQETVREFTQEGSFVIRYSLKDSLNTCGFDMATDTISLLWVDPAMTDIHLPADTILCIDLILKLDASVPFDSTRYCWKTGSLPDPEFTEDDSVYYTSPRYTIETDGVYNITLTDSMGCKNALEINVTFDECKPLLEIPNVFTPNGDGINDVIKFKQLEKCTDVEIEIVNRWGRVVLRKKVKNAEDFEWNGCMQNSNRKLPDGAYFYMVTYKNMYGKKKVQSGSITILGSTE